MGILINQREYVMKVVLMEFLYQGGFGDCWHCSWVFRKMIGPKKRLDLNRIVDLNDVEKRLNSSRNDRLGSSHDNKWEGGVAT